MELKATELRIGNYVDKPMIRIGIVKSIFITHFTVEDLNGVQLGNSIQEKFNPIPLNEKWLLDFGFIDDGFREYQIEGNRYSLLKVGSYKGYLFSDGIKTLREIFTVHELQNLFYSLCGEELTINTPTME